MFTWFLIRGLYRVIWSFIRGSYRIVCEITIRIRDLIDF